MASLQLNMYLLVLVVPSILKIRNNSKIKWCMVDVQAIVGQNIFANLQLPITAQYCNSTLRVQDRNCTTN